MIRKLKPTLRWCWIILYHKQEKIWKKHLFEQYWLCESYSEYWYSSKHSMFDMMKHFENEAKWCATFEFETQFVELLLQKTKNAYISNDKVNAWCIVLMIQSLKNEKQKNFERRTNTKNDMMTMMWNTSQSAIVFETTKTKWKQSSIDTDEMMKNNFISYTREKNESRKNFWRFARKNSEYFTSDERWNWWIQWQIRSCEKKHRKVLERMRKSLNQNCFTLNRNWFDTENENIPLLTLQFDFCWLICKR